MSTPIGTSTTPSTLDPHLGPPPKLPPEAHETSAASTDHHETPTHNRFGDNIGKAAGGMAALGTALEVAEHLHLISEAEHLVHLSGVAAVTLNAISVYETSPARTTAAKLAHAALAGGMSAALELSGAGTSKAAKLAIGTAKGLNAAAGASEIVGLIGGGKVEHYAELASQVSVEKLMNGATGAIVVLLEAVATGEPGGMIAFQKQAAEGKYGVVMAQILDPGSALNRAAGAQSAMLHDLVSAYAGAAQGDLKAMRAFEQAASEGRYGAAIQVASQQVRKIAA